MRAFCVFPTSRSFAISAESATAVTIPPLDLLLGTVNAKEELRSFRFVLTTATSFLGTDGEATPKSEEGGTLRRCRLVPTVPTASCNYSAGGIAGVFALNAALAPLQTLT